MVKERLFIVISLCFVLVTEGFCQKFNYNSQKKQKSEYNEELAKALNANNYQEIGRILSTNPSLVDAASTVIETSKRLKIKTPVPLICDAVAKCLENKCSVKVVETILSYHPNLNIKFDGLPPFYMVLNYIARHKISECGRAEDLFFTFLNKSDIDIKERPAELPPSFSYLLTENFNFLKKRFSSDYISPEIIKAFVDKGASVNTNDVNSNSILSFATLTKNQDLVDYCLANGADATLTNNAGKDAFYYAVSNKDYGSVKSMLENGYPLSESRMTSMKMQQPIAQAGNSIQEMLFNRLKSGKKGLEEVKTLCAYFPNQRNSYLSDGFDRANLNISSNQLPEFIDLFASAQLDKKGASNLEALKKEYVAGSTNLGSFGAALKKYPIVQFNYIDNYYENESTYKALMSELQNLKSFFSPNMIEKLSQEATDRQQRFINSDWKGNPSLGKRVVNGYPYMYDKVVSELYKEIAGMSVRSTDYSSVPSSSTMRDELRTINNQIAYCDAFINGFGESSYAAQASNKLNALSNRSSYVYRTLSIWETRVSSSKSKFLDLERYILSQGHTPPYQLGRWEYYEEIELFGPNTKCHRAKCEVTLRGYKRYPSSYTFYVSKCEDDNTYDIEKSGLLDFRTLVNDCKTIDRGIREAIWKEHEYYRYYSDEKVINFVEFLEQHKNSDWWTY